MRDVEEIEATLRDESSGLRDRIVRDIGNFTVALFKVSESREGEHLELAGTGTLVAVADSHYILTAAHVWEKGLKLACGVGITLRENTDHRFLMASKEIVPCGPQWQETRHEWGPDLMFLRIPSERVGEITAYRTFYNLTRARYTALDVDRVQIWVLMGTPAASGKFTQTYADVQITGFLMQADPRRQTRAGFDYLDLDVDVSSPGTPQTFGGVSGGGLWKVLVYRSASTGGIDSLNVLEGVAFRESDLVYGHRIIRCHGQQSIRAAMPNAGPSG